MRKLISDFLYFVKGFFGLEDRDVTIDVLLFLGVSVITVSVMVYMLLQIPHHAMGGLYLSLT